jgi:DNA-binding PadR family transcriptional regulator
MTGEVRITTTVAQVLRVFLEDVSRPRYGYELMKLTGFPSGKIYPVLARLVAAGWLTKEVEQIDPEAQHRPARRMYRITNGAAEVARVELAALSEQLRPPSRVRGQPRPEGRFA